MNDALVNPAVAGVAGIISATMLVISLKKVKQNNSNEIIPTMGVMGAFIFVAQMINFSIPGTGSSGHIIGAVLLSAILGPWAGFIVLSSVLIIQCLIFADGGLLALGCNIFNMGVLSCLIAYPLFFKPFIKHTISFGKLLTISVITCVIGLELGAFAVTIETTLSGITALPMGNFLLFMLPIHLAIGICEGVATAIVLHFIQKNSPIMLYGTNEPNEHTQSSSQKHVIIIAIIAILILGTISTYIASSYPDGLEWSIINVTGDVLNSETPRLSSFALMPDYNHPLSGIAGSILVIIVIYAISTIIAKRTKQ